MSWRKHFTVYDQSNIRGATGNTGGVVTNSKYTSWLPEVYMGPPNRLERYMQYDQMDADSEVNAALDIIAEFCTQVDDATTLPFQIHFKRDPSETEIDLLQGALRQWCNINDMDRRAWRLVRSTLKYGDQFFMRDPETWKLYWIDPAKIEKVIVNEGKGKKTEEYWIKDLDLNLQSLVASNMQAGRDYSTKANPAIPTITSGTASATVGSMEGLGMGGSAGFSNAIPVDATNIVHISLTEGLDNSWPFGTSILEPVYKIFKQKEMLEDAILIYRVQRAPERRVFYVDVGDMPRSRAMAFIEQVKNEIHQKRIPNKTGGGLNIMDAAYNPLSMIEDYFFAQTCLSLDTQIELLDGRTLRLQEIIDEYQDGKTNFVYGLSNITHEMEPAEIKWAGVTRKNTQVLEVHLDNDEIITVTPDHRFIMRDGSEVEAQNLKLNDSLMPLELINGYSGPKQKNKKYARYRSNADGKIKFVHAEISGKQTGKDTQVHHIDFDSKNNNPLNLRVMVTEDHIQLHREAGTYSLNKQWNDPISREKLITGMRSMYANADEQFMERLSERNTTNAINGWKSIPDDNKDIVFASLSKNRKKNAAAKKIKYSIEMFNYMVVCFDNGANSISKLSKVLREDECFKQAFANSNPNILRDKNRTDHIGVTDTTLNNLVKQVGFNTFGDWKTDYTGLPKFSNKEIVRQNHKVQKVVWLTETIDTGDITIESTSDSHWFGLSSGIYVHNSDGRGSRVETLPGGENLGQIDDLKYFNNKLLRGLRVPSSYLPTGPEDGTAVYSDGRVGTAFIQEYRFTNFCKRLQDLISPWLDDEFKLFCKHRGIEVEASLFELEFTEPQNFGKYRQIEVDGAQMNVFSAAVQIPFMSKRFAMKRYLGWTDEEIQQNERQFLEETGIDHPMAEVDPGMIDVGVRPMETGELAPDIDADLDLGGDMGSMEPGAESPISGAENAPAPMAPPAEPAI